MVCLGLERLPTVLVRVLLARQGRRIERLVPVQAASQREVRQPVLRARRLAVRACSRQEAPLGRRIAVLPDVLAQERAGQCGQRLPRARLPMRR